MKKIIVIGGSTAGMIAATSAAKQNPDAKVTVVSRDKLPYRRPAIPALISGYITGPQDAKIFGPETLARYNIKLNCPAEATDIDTKSKTITIQSNGNQEKLTYDAAVIAVGGHALIPKIAGADKKGVCTFTTYEGAAEIVELAKDARSAVVVGAGFIALEIAEALMHRGLEVYFNVRSRILRKLLEPDVSELLSRKYVQQGLKILADEAISEIGGKDKVEHIVHKGQKIDTNLVVMGAGVKPNVALAERCGIDLGATGAIKVNNYMQSSAADIYAVGDCAESPDLGTGRFVYMPVGSIGACAAKIAGANAAGAGLKTLGFLRAQADVIFGLQIFSIGHSSTSAKEVGLKINVCDLNVPETATKGRATSSFETAKILTDEKDNIVGAQLVTQRFGSQFAFQLYRAVLEKKNKKEFLESFYCPREKYAETLMDNKGSAIEAEKIGEDNVLKLARGVSLAPYSLENEGC